MTRISRKIESNGRTWSDERWALLEPDWLVARHLLAGGWSWRSKSGIHKQLSILRDRVTDAIKDTPRELIVQLQHRACIGALLRGWGVTGDKDTPRTLEIKATSGYKLLVGFLKDTDARIEQLKLKGIKVNSAVLHPSTFKIRWGKLSPEEKEAVLRDMFKTLETTTRKVKTTCGVTWPQAREITLTRYPEIAAALEHAEVNYPVWVSTGERP